MKNIKLVFVQAQANASLLPFFRSKFRSKVLELSWAGSTKVNEFEA